MIFAARLTAFSTSPPIDWLALSYGGVIPVRWLPSPRRASRDIKHIAIWHEAGLPPTHNCRWALIAAFRRFRTTDNYPRSALHVLTHSDSVPPSSTSPRDLTLPGAAFRSLTDKPRVRRPGRIPSPTLPVSSRGACASWLPVARPRPRTARPHTWRRRPSKSRA